MIVAGLDLSATATGIAILQTFGDGKVNKLYEEEISVKGKGLDRALAIADRIGDALDQFKPEKVALEGYGFGNAFTLAILVEVGTVVRLRLKLMGLSYLEVPPNSIKLFVTGAGNAQKDKVLLELYKRWGLDMKTNNTGDAAGVALVQLGVANQVVLTEFQKKAISKLSSCN
jgi:crossover junction endodeoxyribonuclease RuvC